TQGLLQQLARRELAAGRRPIPGDPLRAAVLPALAVTRIGHDPAKVAPGRPVDLHLAGELVPGHRRQELEQLIGRLQLELPERGADEEAGHDRLADVYRIEQ